MTELGWLHSLGDFPLGYVPAQRKQEGQRGEGRGAGVLGREGQRPCPASPPSKQQLAG